MKALIVGVGKIGRTIAWDLARRPEVTVVGICDENPVALETSAAWIASPKIQKHNLDVRQKEQTQRLFSTYDIICVALPNRAASYKVMEAAIAAHRLLVDILEEYHRRPDAYETEGLDIPAGMSLNEYGEWLHEEATTNGVTIIDGMGFAPGLSNVTLAEGIRKLDSAHTAIARVGGIPSKESAARHPLKYLITWSFDHVLREYMVRANIVQNGQIVEAEPLSDRESFQFAELGRDELLEAAVTPGMPSFIYTRPRLRNFSEKTIRWPGHWQSIDTLRECGLLDVEPVQLDGITITPRNVVTALLEPKLRWQPGDSDSCVMWNTVEGTKDGQATRIDYYLWDDADIEQRISSMARVTAFTAASTVIMLCQGMISQRGIVAPEDAFTQALYHQLLDHLRERNVVIVEKIQSI